MTRWFRAVHNAEEFAAGGASLHHVDVVTRVLAGPAARRLAPQVWAGAETQLGAKTGDYTPTELWDWGTRLIDTLDHDGAEPDKDPAPVNELHLARHHGRPGGTLRGHYDDAAMFDAIAIAIAAAVDAQARPVNPTSAAPRPNANPKRWATSAGMRVTGWCTTQAGTSH
ncbi:MAG: DUF222 domain-containing protein [Pseudonocardiales bacterium]|nr:DUF222 domain-containing protein [Pseudonocardiales bacterium]